MEIISGEIREAGKRGPSSVSVVVELIGVMVEDIVCLGERGVVVVVVLVAGVDIVFCGCVVWLREVERGGEGEGEEGKRNCGMLLIR
jgi:hypothetical protein